MNELELEKSKMDSIKEIADNNIKISEAKNALFKLQEEETEYLMVREKKAMHRIQKTVEDSAELVEEANKNHGQIKELGNEVSQFVQNLIKISSDYHQLLKEFEDRNVEWECNIGQQQDDIAKIKRHLNIEAVQIQNDKKSLEQAKKQLIDDQKKLASDRGTINRTINRLKEGRI